MGKWGRQYFIRWNIDFVCEPREVSQKRSMACWSFGLINYVQPFFSSCTNLQRSVSTFQFPPPLLAVDMINDLLPSLSLGTLKHLCLSASPHFNNLAHAGNDPLKTPAGFVPWLKISVGEPVWTLDSNLDSTQKKKKKKKIVLYHINHLFELYILYLIHCERVGTYTWGKILKY